jgi:hypothetical protein
MRYLLSLTTQKGYLLYQTDIEAAYLQSEITDELYMELPPNLSNTVDGTPVVAQLKRGLYGLKQGGYAWSQCFKEFMVSEKYGMGFKPMTGEPNLYRKAWTLDGVPSEIFVGQYVDDCCVSVSSQEALDWYIKRLSDRFPINSSASGFVTVDEPGLLLSMHVKYDRALGVLRFNQLAAIEALAKKFDLADVRDLRTLPISKKDDLPKYLTPQDGVSCSDYLSIIGSCLHIAQVSRPDISFAVGVLARHNTAPGKVHLDAALDLVKYLISTKHWSVQYVRSDGGNDPQIIERATFAYDEDASLANPVEKSIEERLVASVPDYQPNAPETFIDANLGGDRLTKKSTSGLVIMMNGGPISWSSRLQKLCAQSSTEAEIYAVVDGVKEALHIRLLCEESGIRSPGIPMNIWEDNQACIQMGHNMRGSLTAKHYQLRLRFLNEHIWEKNIEFPKSIQPNNLVMVLQSLWLIQLLRYLEIMC